MPTCKQKIHAAEDQVFNYLSDLQNIVDLYQDKVHIKTLKDLGSACYGKQYRYEVANFNNPNKNIQTLTVEIIEYEPFDSIAWSVIFDIEVKENRNTTYIPTTVFLNCTLSPRKDGTHVKLNVDFEMQAAWWAKLLFYTAIFVFHKKMCQILKDIKSDIEQKNSTIGTAGRA